MTKDVAEAVERVEKMQKRLAYRGALAKHYATESAQGKAEKALCVESGKDAAALHLLLTTLSAREAELAAAREALVAHNDVLRSAFSAAQRDAIHDVRGTTNYRTLADRALDVLNAHHKTTNAARQTLGDQS